MKKPILFHLFFSEWTVSVIVANVLFEIIAVLSLQDQRCRDFIWARNHVYLYVCPFLTIHTSTWFLYGLGKRGDCLTDSNWPFTLQLKMSFGGYQYHLFTLKFGLILLFFPVFSTRVCICFLTERGAKCYSVNWHLPDSVGITFNSHVCSPFCSSGTCWLN